MSEIETLLNEFEGIPEQIDRLRVDLINRLGNLYLEDPKDFEKRFYRLLKVEEKILAYGTAYGIKLEDYLYEICKRVLPEETYKVERQKKLSGEKIADIVISTKISSESAQVVLEVKSFIDRVTSPQSIEHLEQEKKDIEKDSNRKYLVFASSNYGNPSFESWKQHKDWIFLRCRRENTKDIKYKPIWDVVDGYYPFKNLIQAIKKAFRDGKEQGLS